MLEEKARYIVESAQVMRSHYCRTSSRRQYLPEGVHLADLYREFVKCVDEEEGEKVPSHTWFYTFVGQHYNLGTHKPVKDR